MLPLLGYCLGSTVDVWKYSLCVGAFSRQEMITNSTNHNEVYSLGINERLAQTHIDRLKKALEDKNEKTEEISQSVVVSNNNQ